MSAIKCKWCWKYQRDIGTFFHCNWECQIIQPVWRIILEYLSNWLGNTLPVSPRLRLLGDRTRIHSISAGEFAVIMVGITAAARMTLRHWKTPKSPAIKEWVNMMTRTASYEHMHNWISDGTRRKTPLWDLFWTFFWVLHWLINPGVWMLSSNINDHHTLHRHVFI